jgi:5'-nucleotidase
MLLIELENQQRKFAVWTFGRLNPPHYGHLGMIHTLQKIAKEQNGDWFLFVSPSHDPKKNPLSYEQKIAWIEALFPETVGHLVKDPSIKNPLAAATFLYKKGYHACTFVAGEDDMENYRKMILSGNEHGIKNPDAVKAGKGFVFNPVDFAISPRLASATNARASIANNDKEAFARSILGPKITNQQLLKKVETDLFNAVRQGMALESQNNLKKKFNESKTLDKPTPNIAELAEKYHCSLLMVELELKKGIKVEMEHTSHYKVAREIALDHLNEKLDYYKKLEKVEENFADGKGPGRTGDSQRHGIPKGASIAQLEKAAKAPGRKGQLARWQLNMRRGKKRAAEDGAFAFGGGSGGNADAGNLLDRHVAVMPWDKETPVTEVADQPYRYMLAKRTDAGSLYIFQTDSGTRMMVGMSLDRLSDGDYGVDMSFADQSDAAAPTIGITGKGDAFRIFATVVAIIKEYFAKTKFNIRQVTFKGKSEEPSRIKLYDRLAQQLPKIIPGFRFKGAGSDGVDKVYYFERTTEESLEETLKKVKGKWALVSRKNPKKVLQYYKGSGHPSKEWVSKVERRIHSFESNETNDKSIKPRVYLDMDGVLADFFGEWAKLDGKDHYKDINDTEKTLQMVREHPTFWTDLPLLPHAKDLIKTVIDSYGYYYICTKPLEDDPRCRQGKLEWIKKNLSDMMPRDVFITANKAEHALTDGIPNILVDDYGTNISAWKSAGGIGIKYQDDSYDSVAAMLKNIAKTGGKL